MAPRRRRTVYVLASQGSLRGLGAASARLGLTVRRIAAIRAVPRDPPRRGRPRRPVDAVVVTSRHAIGEELRRWTKRSRPGATPEIWAAGPGSAGRLRRLGYRRVRQGRRLGADAIADALGPRVRRVAYLRSDLAGERLARALRARGISVLEVVTYRVVPAPAAVARHARGLGSSAAVLLGSPSSVRALTKGLGPTTVRRWGRSWPAIVLGARTASAARAAGFRIVRVAATTDPQRLARELVRTVDDAAH